MGNTFTWIGGSAYATIASDWSLVFGTGTSPNTGDTAIITAGTVLMPPDFTFGTNVVEIAGTGGIAAALVTSGDGSITLNHPTVDQATTIESQVPGQSAAGTTVLDALGTFVNQGTIEANGTLGSTFTIDVQTGTAGNPGIFINESEIDVAVGNAMTIAVGPNAAFYNASLIQVAGGSLDIITIGTGQFDGGYAPERGVVVISQGGTVEDNTAYGTTVAGVAPYFAFADNANNTLKIDQPAQFGGRILGFAAGDTIDLGASLAVAGVSYDAATGILALENGGGTTVASLAFVSGDFQTGSIAVSGTSAGSFGITTVGTDTVITTTATNEVWNSGSGGVFTAGSNWVGGVAPGASSAVVIGVGSGGTSGAITTGGSSIAVQSLMFVGNSDSLVVSGTLGVGPGPLVQGGGTIEVTTGATLGVTALSQVGGGALLLDSRALMTVSGHPNFGYANNGSISVAPGAGYGVLLQGTALINDATLLSSASFNIGTDGSGTPAQVTVTASGVVRDTFASLNSGPTSFGSLTLSGTGTSWTDAGDSGNSLNPYGYMLLGYNDIGAPVPYSGAASLSVSNGATLTEAAYALIGVAPNSAGVANIGSGGAWNIGLANGGYLDVGFYGRGTLDIAAGGSVAVGGVGTFVTGGGTYTAGGIGIGLGSGSSGTIDVNGGVLSTGSGIGVGESGTGLLAVENGGTVAVRTNGIGIGTGTIGSGTVAVSGGTIDVAGGGIAVGKFGSGVLSISDGGIVTIDSYNLYIGGSPSGPSPGAVGLVTLQSGTTGIGGTLGVADNAYVWAGSTLAVDGSSGVDIGGSGSFVGGAVLVDAGHVLTGDGVVAANLVDNGTVLASNAGSGGTPNGGTLEITGALSGTGTVVLDSGATLRLDAALNSGPGPGFAFTAGAPETLNLGNYAPATIANAITGMSGGDRIEFGGPGTITSAVLNGTTLSVVEVSNGQYFGYKLTGVTTQQGTSPNFLTGIDLATGNAYVQLAGNDVWQWINPGTAAATIASNWTLESGSTANAGYPGPGDTAIVPFGTVILPLDAHLTANTIELGGTAGVTAAAVFSGDTAATYLTPTTDAATLIESQVQGQSTAATSLLDIAGRFVNQGSIAANGTTGSSFTIDVTQGSSGVAGALINYGEIDVAAGNAMTIAAGAGAALFNAGQVMIQGGSLDLTTSGTGALAGGLAPTDGLFVLQSGGTMEVNTGKLGGTTGVKPLIAFADTSNNLLKLDQPGQFNARLLGFGAGDTIDLGTIAAGMLVYNADGLLSVETSAGATLASLAFGTGAFTPGTILVSGSTAANGFIVTDTAGDIRISSGLTNDVWSGGSGTWGVSGTNWSSGTVAAASDTALIVSNGTTDFAVGTGAGAITVNGLVVADGHASLQIADAMTVTPTPVQALGGTIEVQNAATLTASAIDEASRGAVLLLDQGAAVDLTGHTGIGFSNNGTLAAAPGGTIGLQVMGTVAVTGAVLNAGTASGGTGGFISIGQGGGGTGATMLVQDGSNSVGARVTDTYALLSSDPTSFGSLTISGPNTSWTDAGDLADPQTTRGYMVVGDNAISKQVPYAGVAQLTVTAGATLTETSYAMIGKSGDSAGSVTVSDYGNWLIGTGAGQPGFLDVGRSGQGSLLISAPGGPDGGVVAVGGGGTILSQGTTFVAPYAVDIGVNAGAAGSITVSGGTLSPASAAGVTSGTTIISLPPPRGSTLTAAGQINVGDLGSGTLQVLGGGLVDVTTASGIVLGNQAGGIGGVLVDHSVFEAPTGGLVVGLGGTGALAIQDSGQAYFSTASVKNTVLLQSSGILDVSAGLTVEAGGWVGGGTAARINGTGATGTVTNLGTIEATTGALGVNGTLAGSGTMQIDAGATMVVGGSIAGTDTFVFATGAAPAVLDFVATGPTLANGILNLQAGDQIVLESFSTITGATVAGSTITVTGTLAGSTGSSSVELTNVTFAPGVAQNFTTATATDPFSGAAAQAIQLACFAAGTPIATAAGETPVERLRAGDLVRTASGALRPVRWIGHRRIDLTRHPDPRRARPIRVGADAIADGAPTRDVLLSPDHAILYRGGLVPVRLLVNDSTIRRETRIRAVTYYHVELDSHDVLLAAGLAAESYLDTGNRGIFANAENHPLVLHPDFLTLDGQEQRETRSCAPFIADPARAEAAWRALADRAIALGCPPPEPVLVTDPALALLIGTERARALGHEGACFRFALPAGASAVLVSRAAYPQDARPWEEDQRRLGVMVRRLTLQRNGTSTDLPLDDPALDRGWWAPESDGAASWRWTNGAAALPVLDEAAELMVELAGTLAYPLPARGAVRNPDRRSAAAG